MERPKRLAAIKEGPSAGKASIGGHFTLKCANENGKAFSTTSLRGKFALLYFGFTMCPDICPDEARSLDDFLHLPAFVFSPPDNPSLPIPSHLDAFQLHP
jgi:protein SCO1/2|tara:strand:- start:351 stop:650 length:300 start_codon:yes stop_codon:yes gene_type:complete|eukprot:24242-Pelagococcus_subviridis.AAC.1